MRSPQRFSLPLLAAAVAALLPLTVLAAGAEQRVARLFTTARTVEWQPAIDPAAAVLSVQRPDGEVITETFAPGRNPVLQLDGLADGVYGYELRFARPDAAPAVQSGTFTVANGTVVSPDATERRPPRVIDHPFYTDDVSATGGVCAGSDCTSTETYGVANAKLKANNTRLKFEDTSTTAGFATTDWQVTANESVSGGANRLAIEDLTAATVPLVIEGASPSNMLYVDSNGRVGIGTSTPGRTLTIADPISTIIRMEKSATPFQSWDIVANQNNFYVRDVNHESNPFIIKVDAPYDSLVIDANGQIGLGVAAPSYQIHHSSGARLDAGNWTNASSRDVKQDVRQLDGEAAIAALEALEPVTFAYRTSPGETHAGFIAEDVPELVATPDRKGLSSMDVVAVLTKVIQEQQRTIGNLETRLRELERKQ